MGNFLANNKNDFQDFLRGLFGGFATGFSKRFSGAYRGVF